MLRTELESRPLLVAALGLILGLTLVEHPVHLLFLAPAPWVLLTLRSRALIVFGLAAGVILAPIDSPAIVDSTVYVNSDWRVSNMPAILPFGQICDIENGQLRLALTYGGPTPLCPGEIIHLAGVAKESPQKATGSIALDATAGQITIGNGPITVVREAPWIQRISCDWRSGYLRLTARNLPQNLAVLDDSVCFHLSGLLDDETKAELQRTGTVHLISASGLQVVLVAQSLLWLLQWLPIPRWGQLLIVAGFLGLYSMSTGYQPSMLRVAAMSLIANLAYLVRRSPDWPSALALTTIGFLLWRPADVYQPGFQLSFLAVLFMSLFRDVYRWRPGLEAWLYRTARRAVRSSLLAVVVISPLIAFYFQSVPLLSVLAGLLVVVAAVPLVILSLVALSLSFVSAAAGDFAIRLTAPFATFISAVLHSYGGEWAVLQVPPFTSYLLVPYYVCLLMLWRPHVRQA